MNRSPKTVILIKNISNEADYFEGSLRLFCISGARYEIKLRKPANQTINEPTKRRVKNRAPYWENGRLAATACPTDLKCSMSRFLEPKKPPDHGVRSTRQQSLGVVANRSVGRSIDGATHNKSRTHIFFYYFDIRSFFNSPLTRQFFVFTSPRPSP